MKNIPIPPMILRTEKVNELDFKWFLINIAWPLLTLNFNAKILITYSYDIEMKISFYALKICSHFVTCDEITHQINP